MDKINFKIITYNIEEVTDQFFSGFVSIEIERLIIYNCHNGTFIGSSENAKYILRGRKYKNTNLQLKGFTLRLILGLPNFPEMYQ